MDFKSTSQWRQSISSILRKTEENLSRIQRPVTPDDFNLRPNTSMDISYENRPDSSQIYKELSQSRSNMTRLVSETHQSYKQELEAFNDRLLAIELTHNKPNVGHEISLKNLENKISLEIKKFESSLKNLASSSDLKIAEESVKLTHQNQITLLDREFKELKADNRSLKDQVRKNIEDTVYSHMTKNISSSDLQELQNKINTEIRRFIQDHQHGISDRISEFKQISQDKRMTIERKMKEFQEEVTKNKDNFQAELSKVKESILKATEEQTEEFQHAKNTVKNLEGSINFEDIDSKIQSLKSFPKHDGKNIEKKIAQQEATHISILDRLKDLEERVLAVEVEGSENEVDPDTNNDFSLPKKTFEENKHESSELVKIYLNEMGESDDESQGFVSPNVSPMNQVIGVPFPKPQKHFVFNNPTIQEELHEDESLTPSKKSPDKKQLEVDDMIRQTVDEFIEEQLDIGFGAVKEVIYT